MAKTQAKAGYSAKDITVLEGLEPVRLRPGMYIGSTGIRGLHHLVYEIVDNAVDEALAGYNDSVAITIHPDNSVTVVDRGRGIPVDEIEGTGISALEVVLTKLHAGGKFGGDGYKVSGGLHGVGALRRERALRVARRRRSTRDGKTYRQEFARGVPQGADGGRSATATGPARRSRSCPTPRSSTRRVFDATTLLSRLRETAFLTSGLRITFTDERADGDAPVEFHYEGGIKDFVAYINESKDVVHRHVVYFSSATDQGEVEVAMQWNTSYQESVFSFANNINTHEGGSHLSGFRSALTSTMNKYARDKGAAEGEGGQPRGRGRARRPRRRHLRQAHRPAVRGADEDEARQPVGDAASSRRRSTRSSPSSSRRTRPTRARSSTRRSPRSARGRRRARHAS